MEEKNINVNNNKNKGNGLLIGFLIIIIVGLLGVIVFLLINTNSNNKDTKIEEKNELKDVYLTENVVNRLISIVPVDLNWTQINYSAYQNKKVEVSDIDNRYLIKKAIFSNNGVEVSCPDYNLPEGGHTCSAYLIDSVKSTLNSYYGKSNIELLDEVPINNMYSCYIKDNYYVCLQGGGYGVTNVAQYFGVFCSNEIERFIIEYDRAEKDNNNLYLYVKFARVNFKTTDSFKTATNTTFQLYKYSNGNELVTDAVLNGKDYCPTISSKDSWGNIQYEHDPLDKKTFDEKIYEQFKDKMTTYKITYKVGEIDSYTLLSVEPVK